MLTWLTAHGRPIRYGYVEHPLPERFRVPATTAARVNVTRAAGGRVIAVGTTTVRVIESAADAGGRMHERYLWHEFGDMHLIVP